MRFAIIVSRSLFFLFSSPPFSLWDLLLSLLLLFLLSLSFFLGENENQQYLTLDCTQIRIFFSPFFPFPFFPFSLSSPPPRRRARVMTPPYLFLSPSLPPFLSFFFPQADRETKAILPGPAGLCLPSFFPFFSLPLTLFF